jgi:protein-tyrosine-phosphatase/peptidoglycan/xylan/chitin deacetylase (PgdA/CDA1 family)
MTRGKATVFMLHRAAGYHPAISGHDPTHVAAALDEMRRRNIKFVSTDQIAAAIANGTDIGRDVVAFTIDDGYIDQTDVLVPIFLEREIPVTLFAITGLIDGIDWPWDCKINWTVNRTTRTDIDLRLGRARFRFATHDARSKTRTRRELVQMFSGISSARLPVSLAALEDATDIQLPSKPPTEYTPTTWTRLRELERAGLRVAPHTVTHRIVSRLSPEEARWEVEESTRRLKDELASPSAILAWPVGRHRHFGERELDLAAQTNMNLSFSALEGDTDLDAARQDPRARHQLSRRSWTDSVQHSLLYATGLQSLRERFEVGRYAERLPNWLVEPSDDSNGTAPHQVARRIAASIRRHRSSFDSVRTRAAKVGAAIVLNKVDRLVFVCMGNVCRSPFAEAVAQAHGWRAASCGLEVEERQPANEEASKVALMLGVDLTGHWATPVSDLSFCDRDCLVAMEPEHLAVLRDLNRRYGCQTTLLGPWARDPATRIPDPFGRRRREMERVLRMVEEGVNGLIAALKETRSSTASRVDGQY